MADSRSKGSEPRRTRPAAPPPRPQLAERLRRAALAALVALLVATPLLPSESAAEAGTGNVLAMSVLALSAAVLIGGALVPLLAATGVHAGAKRGSRQVAEPPQPAWNDRLVLQATWADAAALAVAVCYGLSGWFMADSGNPRATINACWQWLALVLLYLLARLLLRAPAERRAACVVSLALATALSGLACYQYFVTIPRLQAQYEADPERLLREAGVAAPEGSAERKLFVDRLESSEPTATFALTNSLAGFLAPWLIVGAGIGLVCWRDPQTPESLSITESESAAGMKRWTPGGNRIFSPPLAGALLCVLFSAFCLMLTKSRAAALASALGLLAIAVLELRGRRRIGWRIPLLIAMAIAACAGGALAIGAVDWLVLSETPKSILYRTEYWRATMALIRDYPWFGCGPGNFQQYYPLYKLPQASETVADPHNFVLEVWANAGTPAMLALLAFLALLARLAWRTPGDNRLPAATDQAVTAAGPPAKESSSQTMESGPCAAGRAGMALHEHAGRGSVALGWIWGGAVAGFLLAFPLGLVAGFPPPQSLFWIGLPLAGLAVFLLRQWAIDGRLPGWLLPGALAVLLLNLSAAGGIGFAGVASSFWLLAALIASASSLGRPLRPPAWLQWSAAVAAVLVAGACYRTMYAPLLEAQSSILAAMAHAGQGRMQSAEDALRDAAAADPYSPQPWLQLAAVYHQQLLASESPPRSDRFDAAVEQARRLNPRSFAQERQIGDWRLALYRRGSDQRQLRQALDSYARAADLHPTSSLVHAQLSWVWHVAGRADRAAEEAAQALRLDALMPHGERKLRAQQVYEPQEGKLYEPDAEQLMRRMRRAPT